MEELKQGKLVRSLGLFSVFILVVSSVIGSGIYKKVAPMSAELQSPSWVLLCWILAGVVTLCGALSNAEVAGVVCRPGGGDCFFRKNFNKIFFFLFGFAIFVPILSACWSSP